MKQKNIWLVFIVLLVVVAGIIFFNRIRLNNTSSSLEQAVINIPLLGSAAEQKAEISGLAWYGDNLILLPQYPNIFDENGDGFLYYLPKAEILAYLDGENQNALEPRAIQLIATDLADQARNYQGFEAIGFSDSKVFITLEAGAGTDMQSYLISGEIDATLTTLTLDTTHVTLIPPQAASENHSDEALLVLEDKVITFYEVNGKSIVANPVAHVFDFDLNSLGTIPMPNLEYRLTDTALTSGDEFWGINYFFPGEASLLPEQDPIATQFGEGETHTQYDHVERLVKFQYTDSGIQIEETAPIQLTLTEAIRNWEGLVLLDDKGFLMVTDKFPETILGFVPLP